MSIFGNPSVLNFLWLIAGGFGAGLGWHVAAWAVSRTFARV
jgi:uncharacterized membrane protein YccF (DUF307 family)